MPVRFGRRGVFLVAVVEHLHLNFLTVDAARLVHLVQQHPHAVRRFAALFIDNGNIDRIRSIGRHDAQCEQGQIGHRGH